MRYYSHIRLVIFPAVAFKGSKNSRELGWKDYKALLGHRDSHQDVSGSRFELSAFRSLAMHHAHGPILPPTDFV